MAREEHVVFCKVRNNRTKAKIQLTSGTAWRAVDAPSQEMPKARLDGAVGR